MSASKVIEYQLIEILPSIPLSHRKASAIFLTIFFSQLAVVTFFETSLIK